MGPLPRGEATLQATVIAHLRERKIAPPTPTALKTLTPNSRAQHRARNIQRNLKPPAADCGCPGADGTPEAGVQRLDRVRRTQHASDLDVVGEERGELLPYVQPQAFDGGVGAAPLVEELVAGPDRVVGGGGRVDRFQLAADLVPVLS